MRSRILFLACLCVELGMADQQLARVRAGALRNLKQLPDFTCLETVDRSYWTGSRQRKLDTLRLESSYVGGRELVSLAGQGPSSGQLATDIANGSGLVSLGDFALHLKALLTSEAAEFSAPAEETRGGRATLRWTFRVPQEKSTYVVGTHRTAAFVAYTGTLWADAATFDPVRLELRAIDVPKSADLLESETKLDFGRVLISGVEVLLTTAVQTLVVDRDHRKLENDVVYSGCRKFVGESTLSFGDPPPGPAAVAAPLKIPAGIVVSARLASAVDLQHAAVGDTVHAVLAMPLRKGDLNFPKGSRLTGLISTLIGRDGSIVGLWFHTLESGERKAAIRLDLDDVAYGGRAYSLPYRAEKDDSQTATLPVHRRPGESVFTATFRLPAGLRLEFHTIEVKD